MERAAEPKMGRRESVWDSNRFISASVQGTCASKPQLASQGSRRDVHGYEGYGCMEGMELRLFINNTDTGSTLGKQATLSLSSKGGRLGPA